MQRRTHLYWTVAALAMVLALLALFGRPARAQGNVWVAQYWNNKNLSGNAVYAETVPSIDFYWGYDSPRPGVVNSDNWSARFTQNLYATAGYYRILARMDDGMRIYVDDKLVIDSWYDSQEHAVTRDVYLPTTGYHSIRVDYFDSTGVAMAVIEWSPLSATGGTTGQFYPNWKAEYFANQTLAGVPALVRDEAQIDFKWGSGSPDPNIIPNDHFSARFTRQVEMPAGQYRLQLKADDGARLYLNDRMVIDAWKFTGAPVAVDYFHDGKPVNARVEYYEGSGNAQVSLSMSYIGPNTGGGGGGGGTSSGQCPPAGTYQAVFTANSVVRTGPSKDYDVVTSVERCSILVMTGYKSADNRWVSVRKDGPGGYEGWADSTLLTLGTPVEQLNPWMGSGYGGGGSSSGGSGNNAGNFGGVYLPPATAGGSPIYCPAAPSGSQALALNNVNIRGGAGREYPILTTIQQCTIVTLTGSKALSSDGTVWVSVSVPGTAKFNGWIDAKYLMLGTPVENLGTSNGDGAVG